MIKSDHRRKAIEWLKILRSGTGQYDQFICLLRKEIHKGGISLSEIGTSQAELLKLKNRGYEMDARKWLGFMRSDPKRSDFFNKKMGG